VSIRSGWWLEVICIGLGVISISISGDDDTKALAGSKVTWFGGYITKYMQLLSHHAYLYITTIYNYMYPSPYALYMTRMPASASLPSARRHLPR